MRPAVLGLIGAGYLANAQHLPNLMYTTKAKLKTVCDVREDAVKAAQAKYKIPNGTTDYKQVLADPEIEGIVVVTREQQHAELTIAGLRAGKHVFVEKPLASSVAECEAIVAEEKKSGKHVAVGFNRRFAPAYRKAKELLSHHGGAKNIYYRVSDTYAYTWGVNYPPGVRVFHETCHIFDILRWLTDSEITGVFCLDARHDDESILCRLSNGSIATIISSGYATLDWPKEYMEVIAEKGGLSVENFVEMRTFGFADAEKLYRFRGHFHPDKEWTQRYLYEALGSEAMHAVYAMHADRFEVEKKRPIKLPEGAEGKLYYEYLDKRLMAGYDVDKGWLQSMEHFGECIVTGMKPENSSATDGLRAEQLAHAVVESRKTGKLVTL